MPNAAQFHHDLALLDWHIELGADEAISETPINRYELVAPEPKPKPAAKPQPIAHVAAEPAIFDSTPLAQACDSLESLRAAVEAFEHCQLKQGARNTVFCDGNPAARVMIIGEAPGREEDREGKPFIGRAGQLLDKMFAAIGLSRHGDTPESALYIINVLPWRPPQNRDPKPEEINLMKPFLLRHIELAQPDFIVTMGNPSTKTLRDTAEGITKMRGQWGEVQGIPSLPLFHPAYLLRSPEKKRQAWADLLSLKARLETK
ncbi:MAG TPA: uracil-DNA glycosylase [Rhodobacteraceae bacterium]|nr:uracil-DNA glycosylase [Paracoccaceae bacterium]